MKTALIGYTGFVGGNLNRQLSFSEKYNTKNIGDIKGKNFDVVYCAGVSAVKWLANKEPEQDLGGIVPLLTALESVHTKRFVLLSTIDIYRNPAGVDEDTTISTDGLHAYGTHRRMVETFVQERFANHHIIRLPGLFGDGLKKNIIYDLMSDNQVENVHADAIFQFYGLDTLSRDIQTVIDNDLFLVNFATEPVSVKDVVAHAFGKEFSNRPNDNPPHYDMKTKYAGMFGGSGTYISSRLQVLEQIKTYVERQMMGGSE